MKILNVVSTLILTFTVTACSGQTFSQELEIRNGFKDIKLDSTVSSVPNSFVTETETGKTFHYSGETKYVYNARISALFFESDYRLKITKIKIFVDHISDETFFSLPNSLKETFGSANYSYKKENKTDGTLVWLSKSNYLEFIYSSYII